MAILASLPGIKVCIGVADGELAEYDECPPIAQSGFLPLEMTGLSPNDVPTVTKYIESTEGQEFHLKYIVGVPFVLEHARLFFQATIDGVVTSSRVLEACRWRMPIYNPWLNVVEGLSMKDTKDNRIVYPYMFSAIEGASETPRIFIWDMPLFPLYGEISVELFYADGDMNTYWPNGQGLLLDIELENQDLILGLGACIPMPQDVQSFASIYHRVSYGQARAPVAMRSQTHKAIARTRRDDKGVPIAKFVFKYRSRDALKELGIIERTPLDIKLEEVETKPNIDQLSETSAKGEFEKREIKDEVLANEIKQELDYYRNSHGLLGSEVKGEYDFHNDGDGASGYIFQIKDNGEDWNGAGEASLATQQRERIPLAGSIAQQENEDHDCDCRQEKGTQLNPILRKGYGDRESTPCGTSADTHGGGCPQSSSLAHRENCHTDKSKSHRRERRTRRSNSRKTQTKSENDGSHTNRLDSLRSKD